MRKIRKILTLLITLSLLISLPVVTVLAADSEKTELEATITPVYGGAKAMATLTFDDSVYTTALLVQQMCEKYGMEATMMMWIDRIGATGSQYADAETWNELFAKGQLEPQSHSYSHADLRSNTDAGQANQTDEIIQREIVTSKSILEEMFPKYDILTFASAFGGLSANATAVAQQHYYAVRGVSGSSIQTTNPGTSGGRGSWANLYSPGVTLADATEEEQWEHLKQIIDSYVEAGGWYTPFIHRVGDENGAEMSSALTDRYFAYLDTYQESGALWVTKQSNAVKYIRERQNSTASAYIKGNNIYVSASMASQTQDGLPLPTSVFNQPLTVRVNLPEDCAGVSFVVGGVTQYREARKDDISCYAYIDVLPNGGETVVTTIAGVPGQDPTDPLLLKTSYGRFLIPDTYADETQYPWVVFNSDGTFIEATDNLIQENYGALRHQIHQNTGETHYIFLRTDKVEEKYLDKSDGTEKSIKDYYNLCFIKSNVVIDLLGHTMTTNTSTSAFLYLQAKSQNTHSIVTFANGNIVAGNKKPFMLATGSTSKTGHFFEFHFNNITFSIADKANAPEYWLVSPIPDKNNATTKGLLPYKKTLNFTDCAFDVTNLPTSSYIFAIGDRLGNLENTINIYGGDFYGDLSNVAFYRLYAVTNTEFNILKNKEGNYPTNTRPTTAATPKKILNTEDGMMSFSAKVAEADGYATYALAVETSEYATPYGFISESYQSIEDYPMVVFDLTKQTVVHGSKLFHTQYTSDGSKDTVYGALEYITKGTPSNKNYVIFLRKDIGTDAFSGQVYNLCNSTNSVIIIDLNGKTLTAKRNIFRAQLKSNEGTQQFLVKNGTLDTNGSHLIQYGSTLTSAGVEISNVKIDFVFDGVTIKLKSGTYLLKHDSSFKDYVNTLNVTFNECDIQLASTYTGSLIGVDLFANFKTNVIFRGGTIQYAKAAFPNFVKQKADALDNYTLTLLKGENGGYPAVITKTNTTAVYDETVYPTEDGELLYAIVSTEGGYSTYRLSKQVKHGYIDDLHFDEKKYPIVMFTVGDPSKTWYPEAFGGETGNTIVNQFFRGYSASSGCGKYYGLDSILWLRSDYTITGTNYWIGNLACEWTIDLDGHTLTPGALLIYMQARSAGQADIIIKDGTLIANGQDIINYGTVTADGKVVNVTFENVVFDKISKSIFGKTVFTDSANANHPNRDKYTITMNVTFNNCTFNIASNMSASNALFNFGSDERGNISVHVNGGTINISNNKYAIFSSGWAGRTIDFGTYKGEYTKVNIASGVDISTKAEINADGMPMQYYLLSNDGTTATYTLYPFTLVSAYLNITNDLNLVYRVLIPDGYENPVAVFVVNDLTIEVTEYTRDKNGCYLFKLSSLGPHKMADVVSATVTASYNGKSTSVTHNTLSVKSYAEALRLENSDDKELCALLDALLIYGANAQIYMNYNTDNLVAQPGTLSEIPEGSIVKGGVANEQYRICGIRLRLNGAFDFGVRIQATDLTNLSLKVSVGESDTLITLGETMKQGDDYIVYYNGLIASDLDEQITFTLVKDSSEVGNSFTLTANAYLAELQTEENEALTNLVKSLYIYGNMANAYLESFENTNFVPEAEIVNKGGAEGTVSYVIDDNDQSTATFANSLLDKYGNLTLTYAMRTRYLAELITEEGPDGLLHYRQTTDGSYLYTLNEPNVAFWREITKSDRVEIVNHTHTHQYWGNNDDGGEFRYVKTSDLDTVLTSVQPVGSSSKELYASMQIIKELFGDLDHNSTLSFIAAGIGVYTGDRTVNGEHIESYNTYYKALLKEAIGLGQLATVRGTFQVSNTSSENKVVNKEDLVTVNQRMNVNAYMILNANAGENIENWTAYIDHALEQGGWAPFCIHLITKTESNTHHILQSQADALFAYTASLGDRVWVATYTDASLYFCEWSTAKVNCEYADGAVKVMLTDEENDEVFNMPLTVKVTVPKSFRDGAVVNGETLEVYKNTDGTYYVLVDIVPDSGAVAIRAK